MRASQKIVLIATLALGLAVVGLWLDRAQRGWGQRLARGSYDLLQVLQPGGILDSTSCPVVLVYLDLESHLALKQDPARRWDRALHTRLVRRLTEAGARAVVFDVLFDTAWPDPAVDEAFAGAMRAHGRVVLSAERHESDQSTGQVPGLEVWGLQYPTGVLREAAAAVGAAELEVDEDFVVRHAMGRIPELEVEVLSETAARVAGWGAGAGAGAGAAEDTGAGNNWLRYYGRPLSVPHVSYRSVLEPGMLPDAVFRDRVVFVGARPMAGVFRARRDEHRHPLSMWARTSFMPGVEVHATQFLNRVRGEFLRRLDEAWERVIIVVAAIGLSVAVVRLRVGWGTAVLMVMVGTTMAGAGYGWVRAGTWFPWLVVSGVMAPLAWGVGVVHHGLDWHRHRRVLEAQRDADRRKIERQAALIDKAQDVIVVTDLEGRVGYANPAGRRLLEGTTGTGNGKGGAGLLAVPDFSAKRAVLVTAGEWTGTFEQPDGGGVMRSLDSHWTLLRDEAGRPESILIIGTDVTERRRLEAEFLRAQKWEAVGSLAGGMAHDLNNRLAPALLGLQWLQRSVPDEEVRRQLAMIETHTRQGAETVRQVLQFLRGGAVAMTELDVGELLRELEALVRETFPRSIRVVGLIAPGVGRVRGNTTQLQQALLNLCLNARDAMPEGGQLTFAADDVDLDETESKTLRGGKPGKYVMIAISDSGSGIEPENLARIFDPLFTTKAAGRGTGLGLPSVLRTVEQHGGCVGVTSEVGAGSTFELYLPRIFAFDRDAGRPTG